MRRPATAWLRISGGLFALGFSSGCVTPAQPASTPTTASTTAQVQLLNLSAYAWSVTFTPSAGGDARTAQIPAGETITFTLPAGDYRLTQTALNGLPLATASRELPATFLAGETYRWPLVTLLTGNPNPP